MVFVADEFTKLTAFYDSIADKSFGAGVCFTVKQSDALNYVPILGLKEFS